MQAEVAYRMVGRLVVPLPFHPNSRAPKQIIAVACRGNILIKRRYISAWPLRLLWQASGACRGIWLVGAGALLFYGA